jgi:hypothetical protein
MAAVMEDHLACPTVVNHMLREWKLARLSGDMTMAYPHINIIAKMMILGHGGVSGSRVLREYFPEIAELTDAQRVQFIVEHMQENIRGPFEAYHLGIVRGDSCRGTPHRYRALILGLEKTEYFRRVDTGWRICQLWIGAMLDFCDQKQDIVVPSKAISEAHP